MTPAAATAALIERDILLDWPPAIESTRAGRALVATTANLVVRFCPQVRLRPATALAVEVGELLVAIDSSADPFRTLRREPLRVHLGGGARADVTGSADGWLAHVSGYGEDLPPIVESDVVIGAHGAAAIVASQVFARALPLDPRLAGPSRRVAYSFFEYGPPSIVPPRVGRVDIDSALLCGCGAVGQACVDVLVGSDVRGNLGVVDHGRVDDVTNLNRSVLALEQDFHENVAKVRLALRRAAGSSLTVAPYDWTVERVVGAIEAGVVRWPRVVLSALDNRPARWAAQGLWPDLVLEGATGETMAQIFRHAHTDGSACLRCLHPTGGPGRNYLDAMARATGLDRGRIADALSGLDEPITERDVDAATPETREIFLAHLGGDVCGMLTDVERYLGAQAEPVQLSVAFSSYLAGVFLAGELIKASAGLTTPLVGRYQIDPIASLDPGAPFVQAPTPACFCQTRAAIIEALRSERMRERASGLSRP